MNENDPLVDGKAPVQTEIQDKTPPAVRARDIICSDKKLSPGAKFFGVWITDNTYNHWRGGDGEGRLTIAVRDIRALIGHDKKSITRWNKELHHHIWIEQQKIPNAYPVNVYCVRELVPGQQQMEINGLAKVWGRIRGARGKFSPGPSLSSEGKSTSQVPVNTPSLTQSLPLTEPQDATSQVARCHLPRPQDATSQVARFPLGGGKNGSGEVARFPLGGGKNGSGEAAKAVPFKETPKEIRRQGEQECVPGATARAGSHSPIPKFEPLDQKMIVRLRQKHGPEMIDRHKERIYAMENSRRPLPNQKEIIALYRQRIRDIKNWMDGIIEPAPEKKAAGRTAA